MSNLFQRIITSVILLFILLITLFFNKYIWLFGLILVSLVLFIEFNNLTKKIWKNKKNIITSLNTFSLLFLVILIYVSYESYYMPPIGLVFIISICIFSDTGGYIVGNLIGGRKLTKISPNKTISGAAGSIIFTILGSPMFVYFLKKFDEVSISLEISAKIYIWFLMMSIFCQVGDLLISYLKRKAKVEDTGAILPGHGGILDRVDGIIFAIPLGVLAFFLLELNV